MYHAGIGFLPAEFHSLHRFLSLSNSWLASWIICSKRVRSSGTVYCTRIVNSDPLLSEVILGNGNGRWWHGAAAVVRRGTRGQELREPPKLRTPDRSRITLAKAAELETLGGAG
jgi:hypothetical protein